jgi:hypothetical protein
VDALWVGVPRLRAAVLVARCAGAAEPPHALSEAAASAHIGNLTDVLIERSTGRWWFIPLKLS